tara:strand:- start:245 stop:652 length:408 start_codon:yes stop_codon:yes gene_type:complete
MSKHNDLFVLQDYVRFREGLHVSYVALRNAFAKEGQRYDLVLRPGEAENDETYTLPLFHAHRVEEAYEELTKSFVKGETNRAFVKLPGHELPSLFDIKAGETITIASAEYHLTDVEKLFLGINEEERERINQFLD